MSQFLEAATSKVLQNFQKYTRHTFGKRIFSEADNV